MVPPLLVGKLERAWLGDKRESAWYSGKIGNVVSDTSCMRGLAWDDRQVVEEALVGMEPVAGAVPPAQGGTPGWIHDGSWYLLHC